MSTGKNKTVGENYIEEVNVHTMSYKNEMFSKKFMRRDACFTLGKHRFSGMVQSSKFGHWSVKLT